MSSVVVVESPAKAKTINKYLGGDYTVLASYGHVRDLPPKNGSVLPDDDFSMIWEIDDKAQKHVREIAKALKGADHLYLATDPDREGEAISWHVQEILNEQNALKDVDVKRVVFNEITKDAILQAFEQPRELDSELVEAYLARRALDYLVGFTLSPVLWRKLPGSRSAGRVQSVALRLICERETEIENFNAQEYWSVKAALTTNAGAGFEANLTHLNGEKLDKMDLKDEAQAMAAVAAIESREFSITSVERKQARRNPTPPFTTSTLQQEASRKLRFSAKKTMQVAQRLYEGINIGGETIGLITYMRTDGVQIAGEAVGACRAVIGRDYGDKYVPAQPRVYKSKAKNAQEAHEAVRPTDLNRKPDDIASHLDEDQRKLYALIWKRTLASQMESAVLDQVAVDINAADKQVTLRATGSVIAFDGFYRVYREGSDETDKTGPGSGDDRILPAMNEGEGVERGEVTPEQHFTQPPPRFSEASLVKTMEELGIGRPSTYASIISVLQDRNYVRLEKRRFEPEDRGRVVTTFLESYFTRYVAYDFTADLENSLDDISGGRADWKALLREFWGAFSEAVDGTKDLRVSEVLDRLDELLGPHFFRDTGNGKDPRKCPTCADGRLNLKLGKFGAFIGCSNYPDCRFTRPLAVSDGDEDADGGNGGPKELGLDPETGLMVTLRKGPYGWYVQLGEVEEITVETKGKKPKIKKTKPKRGSVPKTMDQALIDLEKALGLLSLPRDVGIHPETNDMITAAIGRFGPYIKLGGTYLSLKGEDDVLTIGLNRAVHLLADAPRKDPPREIGLHPKDKKPITQREGRWGPYVQHGRLMATLPKGTGKDAVTLEEAVALLNAKAGKKSTGGKGGAKKSGKKKAASSKKAVAANDKKAAAGG
ncbi:MAG: type I DNA topoisomerase [Rhodospirillaceae bacterium]|nr:type I DNA topoisomerase [Rhodospirillaceae bacterium]